MRKPSLGAWFVCAAAVSSSGVAAQNVGQELLSELDRRPLGQLVDELPGRPTSLAELLSVALERNLPLEASRIQRRLAESGVDVDGGDFDLAFSLGAGIGRDRFFADRSGTYQARVDQVLPWGTALGLDLTGAQAPSGTGSDRSYDADVGLSLSQPLLEGLGTRDVELRVSRLFSQAAANRLSRAFSTVAADVELAYWDLAEAEAIQAVLRRSEEIARTLLFRNEQLAARQLVAEVDVITARSGVALRRSTLVDARRRRIDAAEAIVFLVWGEAAQRELGRDTLPLKTEPLDVTPASVPALGDVGPRALDQRRDLAAARLELRGAEVAVEGARSGLRPSLSLDGSLRSGGTDASLGGSIGAIDRGRSWSLGLNFAQPLGNRRDRGLDQIADLTRELRRLDVILVENLVVQEVRLAVRAIAAGTERLEAADEAAMFASQQLEAERRRLDLGLGDSFRLLETEENAVQAELASVRARYDLARALTRYRLAMGSSAGR